MKIKKHYYCLVDANNKPDFRYLFADKVAADKKRKQIKNSVTGETLFVSKQKRDFFVDGVSRKFIDPEKNVAIKKGCWTTLKTKKITLLDTIHPESYFREVIKETSDIILSQPVLTSAKNKESKSTTVTNALMLGVQKTASPQNAAKAIKLPSETSFSFSKSLNLRFSPSFLKSNLLAFNFALLVIICLVSVTYINTSSNKKMVTTLSAQKNLTVAALPNNEISVLGEMDESEDDKKNNLETKINNIDMLVFDTLVEFEKVRADQLESSIKKMVAGTPMEQMAPYIAKKDKMVAAFLVGISKKESNYGRRVPVLNGEDCFNYWGYRGIRKRMGSGGHTCFDSPEDAIETVGGRIERLVKSGVDTPEKMVLWKCGSDCSVTGGQAAADKWIKDVNMYYQKMLTTAQEDEEESEKIKILNETLS